jgi:hypothetical protein
MKIIIMVAIAVGIVVIVVVLSKRLDHYSDVRRNEHARP